MQKAIDLAIRNIADGGGPFGAVVVKDGQVVAEGCNRVTANNDPTAHAEVVAIREACRRLGTFDLSGCVVYASCEPCPMCFSAIYWAHVDAVYYASTKVDAERAGFDDAFIYAELDKLPQNRSVRFERMECPSARRVFEAWEAAPGKTPY